MEEGKGGRREEKEESRIINEKYKEGPSAELSEQNVFIKVEIVSLIHTAQCLRKWKKSRCEHVKVLRGAQRGTAWTSIIKIYLISDLKGIMEVCVSQSNGASILIDLDVSLIKHT